MNQPAPLERQPLQPPAHVMYAHKLGRGMLTFEQIDQLVLAINPAYVAQKNNNSYLSQHQARAEMNRIFGYLNWDSEVEEMKFAYEEIITDQNDPRWPKEKDRVTPKRSSTGAYYLTAYEGVVRVTIRDLWGMPLATYREYHFEENAIQPQRGEARGLAITSVASYALRRALINMGDRFGLGLYNRGSQAPHGQYTQQLFNGQLFKFPDAATVAPTVTHQTIVAEQAVADDVVPSWSPDQDDQQQVPQQQAPVQQFQQQPVQQIQQQAPVQQQPEQQMQQFPPPQQAPVQQQAPQQQPVQQGGMAEFHQAQETLQQGRQEYRQQFAQAPMGGGQQPPQFDPAILAQAQGGFKVDQ